MQKVDITREQRALDMIRETKIANFAKLANMLIPLFGIPEAFKKYVKPEQEGLDVEMEFPTLQGGLIFTLTREKNKFNARWYSDLRPELRPPNIVATIVLKIKREKLATFVGRFIHKKSNALGFLSLVPKLITRKIKFRGSISASLALARIIMLGKGNI